MLVNIKQLSYFVFSNSQPVLCTQNPKNH